MSEDVQLLRRYAAENSEPAFAELVRRHVDLVYSAALRLVHGNVYSAQDVTQQVFTEVARQAKRLTRHPALVGWLYTTTRLIALRVNRTEHRRQAREQEAYVMNELLHDDAPSSEWTQVRPVLEEAMLELNDKDRHAVLLRFFQNKTLNEVGVALNLTDNAARMRVERALDKLRGKLARRGIATTTAGLAALVSANAVQAAPVGFVATLATGIASSAAHASIVIAATKTLAMTTFQKTIVGAALTAALGTAIYTTHHSAQLSARIQTLQNEQAPVVAQIQQFEQERHQLSNQLAALSEENARLKSGQTATDLLKLRGQVGVLRQRAASNETKLGAGSGGIAKLMDDPATKEFMRKAMADKMKTLYGDFIKELKLTPEQTENFVQVLCDAGSKSLTQLSAAARGAPTQADTDASQETGKQLRALLGDAGCVRFKEFSDEMPARATLTLLKDQLGQTPLGDEQSASLIQIIKAEPADLTRGILGGPDQAFSGSQADIDNFLQQVTQSNQRILQQAGGLLNADQLAALDTVLTKAVEARKLQGTAFFPKH